MLIRRSLQHVQTSTFGAPHFLCGFQMPLILSSHLETSAVLRLFAEAFSSQGELMAGNEACPKNCTDVEDALGDEASLTAGPITPLGIEGSPL